MLNHRTSQESTLLGDDLVVWRGSLTAAHILAILSCIFRLHRRKMTGQFWLDDWFALVAFIMECVFFPTLWLRGVSSRSTLIVTAWFAQLSFIPLIWSSRISLAYSITRVIPPHQKARKASIWLVYFFGIVCLVYLIQTAIECRQDYGSWANNFPYQCPLSSTAAISRMIMDCIADGLLIAIPFCAFWRQMKLAQTSRRLIKACFCASVLTTLVSFLASGILFSHHYSKSDTERSETSFMASVLAHLVAAISLLVCNMLIIVTSFYRFFRSTEVVKQNKQPQQQPPPQNSTSLVTETGNSSSSGEQSSQNQEIHQIQIGPLVAIEDTSTSSASEVIVLTELFESDLIHSLPPQQSQQISSLEQSQICDTNGTGINEQPC
ncbi:hypothetical protein JR316_0007891 [Psilocybe cubensis]|uniref:Uncharacterized protein n=1 Tax=Psilocybe cubensis TaxID=181762 RepID=A0ACB8GV42_PSICU|nr:hypothetical protein JR316_0007891 [Psilocybe cubensis]KAH9479302.1 hypothetical protein JR316_0007891 [Psilocybe cubensis]